MKKFLLLITIILWASAPLFAQGTMLLRNPSVSNNHIVFVHANDLWVVDRDGGDARRLTTAVGAESNPRISPDGNYVAFSGEYDGNTDVFVVSIMGGEPERMTWHPGADIVQDWTPDGSNVIFTSGREGYPTANTKFFTVSTNGGTPEALSVPFGYSGSISSDGSKMAYQPYRFWDPEWRNYRGGQAQPIWIFDMETYDFVQTPRTDNERHTSPVWIDNTVYYLSERDFANNVWSYNLDTEEEKQLTFHSDFDAKNLAATSDLLVYEQGGFLHQLDPNTEESAQLEIHVRGDLNWARTRYTDVEATQLMNARLSPTGQRAIFEHRGEIITVPKEHGNWRNLTQTSDAAERAPVWSPDGQQVAYFSDESGEYQLMVGDQYGMEEARTYEIPNEKFYYKPVWSPDGNYIAFTDTDYQLWYIDLSNGDLTLVDTDRLAHPNRTMNPVWSPDSEWLSYARLLDNHFKAIFAHNISTDENHQITDGMADAIDPQWDESGKYLYFLASTDYGLNTGWLDMSSYNMPVNRGLYMIVLADDEPSPFAPQSSDEPLPNGETENGEEEAEEEEVSVRIDVDGIQQRTIAVEVPERNYTFTVAGPEGHIFYAEARENLPTILHRYSIPERESIGFLENVSTATVSEDRKNLLYQSGPAWGIVPTDGPAITPGDGSLDLDNIKIQISPREEYAQIFREGWRFKRDFLYVDNVHGAPWDEVYEWYSPWVDHVRHRSDLNYIVDIMSGEVAVGHSYVSGGDYPEVETILGGLLGADYEKENGLFRIKKIYTGENWNPELTAPLSGPGINVQVGDYLLEVNGQPLTVDMNLYRVFEATAGKQVKIRVNDQPSTNGSRLETVVPIDNESGLRMREWVESSRKKVDEMSDGKLAYVYVPNTGNPGYEYFNRYYFSQQDKSSAVIDERNNGGGSAADYMIDIMSRELMGYFNSKAADQKPFTTPISGIWGPKVMIINENAGSGGDLLPYMFRMKEIGPLIGTKTWGGLVGTWDTPPFIDGGRMVAPRGGFFDVDGEWAVEGEGIAPDIEVFQHPADVARGNDPQLEASVEEALRLLELNPVELKEEPDAPVRWKRPDSN